MLRMAGILNQTLLYSGTGTLRFSIARVRLFLACRGAVRPPLLADSSYGAKQST
ncbi:MAG TPA: hypothetical protein VKU80_11500 [Planctomycetota bacterium]|nr:hypothetical protein [Planctomycetota bacterium]